MLLVNLLVGDVLMKWERFSIKWSVEKDDRNFSKCVYKCIRKIKKSVAIWKMTMKKMSDKEIMVANTI